MTEHVEVSGILVDVRAITALVCQCDPDLCRGESCCSRYDVWVDAVDKERIAAFLPDAASYLSDEKRGDDIIDNYLAWVGAGYVLQRHQSGLCKLAYTTGDGCILCSLHSVALKRNLEPRKTKPKGCMLWPLSLSGHQTPVLSVQEDAFAFACNSQKQGRGYALDPGTASLIDANFGGDFLYSLQKNLQKSRFGYEHDRSFIPRMV